jgi:YegS/Rv2252/BmrU family lipid kinase
MNIHVIYNPAAGKSRVLKKNVLEAVKVLEAAGCGLLFETTEAPLHATALARKGAERSFDIVVAAGGDGTINEVVNGLVGTGAALGVIPTGTENLFAKEMGIPLGLREAARVILHGKARALDLGKVNDRYFICMAGIGADAEVVHAVHKSAKGFLGSFAYALTALKVLMRYRGFRSRLSLDGKIRRDYAWLIVLSNTKTYGWRLKITPRAAPDDGALDLCIFGRARFPGELLQIGRLFVNAHTSLREVRLERAREIVVHTEPPARIQVDGEEHCLSPATISTVPGILPVQLPALSAGEGVAA